MKAYFNIPYRKGRPAINPVRGHVMLDYQGRRLLGEVTAIDYQEGPPSGYFLTVRHFNGEPWPIKPNAGSVYILDRSWEPKRVNNPGVVIGNYEEDGTANPTPL